MRVVGGQLPHPALPTYHKVHTPRPQSATLEDEIFQRCLLVKKTLLKPSIDAKYGNSRPKTLITSKT